MSGRGAHGLKSRRASGPASTAGVSRGSRGMAGRVPPPSGELFYLSPTPSLQPPSSRTCQPTPLPKTNITYPKRHYSISRQDSLEQMETPVFASNERLKETPSSASTVLIMAGLFVCGLTTLLSGLVVLVQQRELPFVIAGLVFLAIGISMLLACALLQRKNIVKFFIDLDQDLYFLKMSDFSMWKMVFDAHSRSDDPTQLASAQRNGQLINPSYMK